MAKSWKCARCSTSNAETAISCTSCGMIRGAVVPLAPESTQPSSTAVWTTPQEPPKPPLAALNAPSFAPAAPARPLWRRIPLGLVVLVALFGIGGISAWFTNASRSPSGDIFKGGDITATDLRAGHCFDLKDPAADKIDKLSARPCAEEHEYEVFYVGTLSAGDYPAEAGFQAFVSASCYPAFAEFVGKPYTESELDVFWIYPTNEAWSSGDRTVQCAAYHPRIHRLTGSLKGSAR